MATQIQLRRGTAAQWTAANPILAEGEMGVELDTSRFKIGNGVNTWSALDYGFSALPAGGTAGQLLAKDTNADYDFIWIDNYTEELGVTIKNDTGVALTKGQVVYVSGASGGKLTVALAKADSEVTSAGTIGVVKATIANGGTGSIIISGTITGLNTSGLTAGAPLWLSPTTAGQYTLTKPTGNDHSVVIGFVENVNVSNGAIYVQVENFPEIKELTGTLINGVTNNEVLMYESSTSLWKNKPIPAQSIATLSDTNVTSIANNYILKYNSSTSKWVAVSFDNQFTIDSLSDVTNGGATNGQVLTYDSATSQWKPASLPTDIVGATNLNELSDVTITGTPTNGQYLVYDTATSQWKNTNAPTIPTTLDGLTDVTITGTPANGDVLTYDTATSQWKQAAATGGGSSYPTITTAVKTTASLATGANEKSTITITQGYRLLKIETDKAARVRLYTTTTGRDADESRAFITTPNDNDGVIFDYITTSGDLSNDLSPTVDGFVATGTAIPITVTNLNGSTGTVTVTLTYVRTI